MALALLLSQTNAAAIYSLFSTYNVLNQILFDHVKAYHQIPPSPEIKQAKLLLSSDNPSYHLPGLNVKIPQKPLSRSILDKETGLIHGKPEDSDKHVARL